MNTLNFTIQGIIIKDSIVYVPLEEVCKFCKKFPTVNAAQISEVIEHSIKNLFSNEDLLKQVPRVVVDSSIIQ
jgi:hypothetical protein